MLRMLRMLRIMHMVLTQAITQVPCTKCMVGITTALQRATLHTIHQMVMVHLGQLALPLLVRCF